MRTRFSKRQWDSQGVIQGFASSTKEPTPPTPPSPLPRCIGLPTISKKRGNYFGKKGDVAKVFKENELIFQTCTGP
jgi:hypothetical protein